MVVVVVAVAVPEGPLPPNGPAVAVDGRRLAAGLDLWLRPTAHPDFEVDFGKAGQTFEENSGKCLMFCYAGGGVPDLNGRG